MCAPPSVQYAIASKRSENASYQFKSNLIASSLRAKHISGSTAATTTTTTTTTITRTTNTLKTLNLCHQSFFLLLSILFLLARNARLGECASAPKSCILCDANDLQATTNVEREPSAGYEEFLFEHQVTRQDAIQALQRLNDSFYEGPSLELACKSVSCTKAAMRYCLSAQFINDHCWCELGHSDEGLPFIPHICYVGEKTYSASVGSCFFYEEVKECCCAPALAKQWRHISLASKTTTLPTMLLALLLLLTQCYNIRFHLC